MLSGLLSKLRTMDVDVVRVVRHTRFGAQRGVARLRPAQTDGIPRSRERPARSRRYRVRRWWVPDLPAWGRGAGAATCGGTTIVRRASGDRGWRRGGRELEQEGWQ